MLYQGQYSLETPENVELNFELAGPGSRFCALMIDTLLIWLIMFACGIIAVIVGFRTRSIESLFDGDDISGSSWIIAILLILTAVLYFGYYTFFEILLRGQTPGKRSMKLRVMRDDGTPASAADIAVRNLLRPVDLLPGCYLVGGLACFFSALHKRLGDLAAGTIVVKENELDFRAEPDRKRSAHSPVMLDRPPSNIELSPEERQLVRGFLSRRTELLAGARSQLAERLATKLYARHGGELGDAESYLERLAEGRHRER